MNIAEAMNFKELHLAILGILAQQDQQGFTPKELIARFALSYRDAYYPQYRSGSGTRITDAKIYGALKYLEKEKVILKMQIDEADVYTDRNVPRYIITETGQDLIKHSMTLSIQSILSTIVFTFFQKQLERFPLLDISLDSTLGMLGTSIPFGYSILTFLKETIESFDYSMSTNPLYFISVDQMLHGWSQPQNHQKNFEDSLSPFIKNTIYRSCEYVNDKFRIDVGNHKLDIILSVMLFTIFPNDIESILDEINRIVKPGGMIIIQEQNFHNLFFPWVLEIIPREEQRLISDLFAHILEDARKGVFLDLALLQTKIQEKFGSILRIDEFGEIKIMYIKKRDN